MEQISLTIHTCVQCFVVATLASACPATPYVFRNYEHPLLSAPHAARIGALPGSSAHEVWQAVRASSAAPYYLGRLPMRASQVRPSNA